MNQTGSSKPNVLFVAERLGGKGGAHIWATRLLSVLLKMPVRVHVLSGNRSSNADLETDTLPDWHVLPGAGMVSFLSHRRFRRRLNRLQPDVMIVNDLDGHRFAERFRNWSCERRAIVLHNPPVHYTGVFHNGVDSLDKCLGEITRYRHLAGVSQSVLTDWKNRLGREELKTSVMVSHSDQERMDALRGRPKADVAKELGFSDRSFNLVCVGSIQKRKGQDLLPDIMPKLAERVPGIQVTLVGQVSEAWGGPEILRRCTSGDLADRFRHIDYADDVLPYIYAANALVMPSRSEGLPSTLLEAMALETPVAASGVNGIAETIRDGENGVLFSVDDPESMVAALVRIASDEGFRNDLAARARRDYEETYSLERQRESYRVFLGEAIS